MPLSTFHCSIIAGPTITPPTCGLRAPTLIPHLEGPLMVPTKLLFTFVAASIALLFPMRARCQDPPPGAATDQEKRFHNLHESMGFATDELAKRIDDLMIFRRLEDL